MLVRATDDAPYVSSYSRLFLRDYKHVVTVYLPNGNRGGRWASDLYEKQLLEVVARYKPDVIASPDINFMGFPELATAFGPKLRKLTPIEVSEYECKLFTELHTFLGAVGLADKDFVLLHRPEKGELFDDRVRECGFPEVDAREVATLGDLRSAIRGLDADRQVIISALPYVTDVEFGTHVFPKDIHKLLRVMHILDISVVSTEGAISVVNDYPVIDLDKGTAIQSGILIFVRPDRLRTLGLGGVPVSGMMYVDGVIR